MIRVNGNEYNASVVFATDGSMSVTFKTHDTLSMIENNFPLKCTIEVVENGEVIAKYYNKEVLALKITNSAIARLVTVVFAVSEIQQSAEDKLSERADTSDGAIEELASLVADQMVRTDSAEEVIGTLEERIGKLETTVATLTAKNTTEVSNG